jgi:hypothetical protein
MERIEASDMAGTAARVAVKRSGSCRDTKQLFFKRIFRFQLFSYSHLLAPHRRNQFAPELRIHSCADAISKEETPDARSRHGV